MKKIITAYLGSADERTAIRRLAERDGVEVIAVTLDLGGGHGLRELHDEARAAGAARCHVLDAAEQFARECVVPAILTAADGEEGEDPVAAAARGFIAKKLGEVAELEGTAHVLALPEPALPGPYVPRTPSHMPHRSAQLEIAFENSVPVSVNGIPMSLTELMDSVATIAAAHGVPGERAALRVLQLAHGELGRSRPATGSARVEVVAGSVRTMQPEYATT